MNTPETTPKTTLRRAFTLVELLTVVLIIMVLLGLVIGVSNYVSNHSAVARTKADLLAIRVALDTYKEDVGALPALAFTFGAGSTTAQYGTVSVSASAALYRSLNYTVWSSHGFRPDQLTGSGSSTRVVDAWMREYNYDPGSTVCRDPRNGDVWSSGKDGLTDRSTATYNLDDIYP